MKEPIGTSVKRASRTWKKKARQMIQMRLRQAREAKAKGDDADRRWCVESALRWRLPEWAKPPL